MAIEQEIKCKIENKRKLYARLTEVGARRVRAVTEVDHYFDTPERLLAEEGKHLRVRVAGSDVICTLKGPLLPSVHKKREELEFCVLPKDTGACKNVKQTFMRYKTFLAELGYVPLMCKEKKREYYSLKGATICIDRLPFLGNYIEIEGSTTRIRQCMRLLGFTHGDVITASYASLFKSFCLHNNLHGVSCSFAAEKKSTKKN